MKVKFIFACLASMCFRNFQKNSKSGNSPPFHTQKVRAAVHMHFLVQTAGKTGTSNPSIFFNSSSSSRTTITTTNNSNNSNKRNHNILLIITPLIMAAHTSGTASKFQVSMQAIKLGCKMFGLWRPQTMIMTRASSHQLEKQ